MKAKLLTALENGALRDHKAAGNRQCRVHERRKGMLQNDRARVAIPYLDFSERLPVADVIRLDVWFCQPSDPLVRELHVLSGDLAVPTMELDPLFEREVVGGAVPGWHERLSELIDDLECAGPIRHQALVDRVADLGLDDIREKGRIKRTDIVGRPKLQRTRSVRSALRAWRAGSDPTRRGE